MKEKYPVLIGHSTRACKKLFTMEQVADFICEQGLYGEVTIETPEGLMLISTYGIYLLNSDLHSEKYYRTLRFGKEKDHERV